MRKPQVGDIWCWEWESGNKAYVLLTEAVEDARTMFMGMDLSLGEAQLWEFDEIYMENWSFIA